MQNEQKSNTDSSEKTYTESEFQEQLTKQIFASFSKLAIQPLIDTSKTNRNSLSFKKFTKENIIKYLQSPQKNEKNIRDASIFMYNNSSHYRRLISYYALMPLWAYTITPYKFNSSKQDKPEQYKKQFDKVAQIVENMQIKHEFQKIANVVFREDVFYGVCWETSDSFFIQRMNPDYCELSSVVDGVYNFVVDMSKIKEEDLQFYPPEFTTMYNAYSNGGDKKQEVPLKISACFKINEDLEYILPIFAGTMVSLHDIEDYKGLQKQRTKVGNYKLVNMTIPTKDGIPTMIFDDAVPYYNMLSNALAEEIAITMSPLKLDNIDFTKSSSNMSDTKDVFEAEEAFWRSAGVSSLLFGGGNSNSSSAKLSRNSDEEIVIAFMKQCERWINRRLKDVPGSIKFKINILPATHGNQDEKIKTIKEAATYGMPVKSMYGALLGLQPSDLSAMAYFENEVLELPDKLIPMQSSHTQSSDSGRPTNESKGEGLTDSGEQTLEDDENQNR